MSLRSELDFGFCCTSLKGPTGGHHYRGQFVRFDQRRTYLPLGFEAVRFDQFQPES